MPGVLSMLAYLKSRGKLLGVATGNLEQIGWLKIEIAGLRDWFTFGGFSDRHAVRSDMIAKRSPQREDWPATHVKVCVVGDTPSDIAAAKANGLPTIAVATGVYPYQTCCNTSRKSAPPLWKRCWLQPCSNVRDP